MRLTCKPCAKIAFRREKLRIAVRSAANRVGSILLTKSARRRTAIPKITAPRRYSKGVTDMWTTGDFLRIVVGAGLIAGCVMEAVRLALGHGL